jgi:hypothetical protein
VFDAAERRWECVPGTEVRVRVWTTLGVELDDDDDDARGGGRDVGRYARRPRGRRRRRGPGVSVDYVLSVRRD